MDELRKNYHHELDQARSDLALLAARVAERIAQATQVLLDSNLERAEELIKGDAEIDAAAVEIEEHCIEILALQAPVAGELRQVLALMKMIAEVERSGDLVANLCKAARRMYGHELDPRIRGIITLMGKQSQAIYTAAIEALQHNDASKAAALDDMDAYLDALQKQFIAIMIESKNVNVDLEMAVQLAMVARFYERIGDHAVNVGERVMYTVTGKVPDHSKPKRPKVQLDDAGNPLPVAPTVD